MPTIAKIGEDHFNLDTAIKFERKHFPTTLDGEGSHLSGSSIPGFKITFPSEIIAEAKVHEEIEVVENFLHGDLA